MDAAIVFVAMAVLWYAAFRPRRVHLATGIALVLVAGLLLWANLRPTGWQEEFGGNTPTDLDPITSAMFWRGWPISPFMFCLIYGLKFHPQGIQWVLFVDAGVYVLALSAVKTVCEYLLRMKARGRFSRGPETHR